MMPKQEHKSRLSLPISGSTLPQLTANQSKAVENFESHMRLEELKVLVLEKAQRNMDTTISVIKNWIK